MSESIINEIVFLAFVFGVCLGFSLTSILYFLLSKLLKENGLEKDSKD